MKLFTVADFDSDWYPKNAISLFQKYSVFEFPENPEEADIIWIFSHYIPLEKILQEEKHEYLKKRVRQTIKRVRKKLGIQTQQVKRRTIKPKKDCLKGKLTLASFHHLYKPKEEVYLRCIPQINKICDVVHFFSERNILENKQYFTAPILLLPYWIDTAQFHPLPLIQKQQIRQSFHIPHDKMVIGSFQRDTEADLVTPKYEKGPDLFCDILNSLDPKRFFVLLAGPRRHYIEQRLKDRAMPFLSLGKIPYEQMDRLYHCLDYYLVTSRCEGGPQAILEAMATKTPIYSTRVGISELLSEQVIFSTKDDFVKALSQEYPDVLETHYRTIQEFECKKVIKQYEKTLFELNRVYQQNPKDFFRFTREAQWYNLPKRSILDWLH